MYINMNGGMKVNKVAFCMEDGWCGCCRVPRGWMECAFGDGLWHLSAAFAFCGVQKPDATGSDGVCAPIQSAWFTPRHLLSAAETAKCDVETALPRKRPPVVVLSGVRKVLAYADAASARPVWSSRSWLKWRLERNKNEVAVMWPFRQSSRCHDVRMLAASRGLVTVFVCESRVRYSLHMSFLHLISFCAALLRPLKGQNKFTCSSYSVFSLTHSEISSQSKTSFCELPTCSTISASPCAFSRFLWLDLIHFVTARNHFHIGQLSFKRKRPAWPVRTALNHKRLRMDVCVSLRRIKIITKPAFHFLLPKAFRRAVYIYHTGDLLLRGGRGRRRGGEGAACLVDWSPVGRGEREEKKKPPNQSDIAAPSSTQASWGNVSRPVKLLLAPRAGDSLSGILSSN